MLIETFLRKQLGLKAHTVTKVEETERYMIVHIDRLGRRLLRCGVCRQRCRTVHSVRKAREWRDLSMRKLPLKLCYRPRRVECPRCGLRVEDFPWAEPWARVTDEAFLGDTLKAASTAMRLEGESAPLPKRSTIHCFRPCGVVAINSLPPLPYSRLFEGRSQ